ncbi:hypothetical protein V2O64_04820 [Verrucomicrobiaceae bacterium 227]
MKFAPLFLIATMALPSFGETVFTIPQGYTKIDIAPSTGAAKLTSISVTLLKDVEFAGTTILGAFTDNADPAKDTQALAVSNVTWTATQWTDDPHIAYIAVEDDAENADGIAPAEEAFLITANSTSGDLTLETLFDLSTKFPASTSIKIRKANTVSSVLNSLSTGSAVFQSADRVFVWNGSGWQSLRFLAGSWRDADSPTTIVDGMVIFPDEGIFVQRTGTGTMTLTLFGEVPSAPQIATIEGNGFLSNRYPVATTLVNLGLQDSNWQGADRVYIWDGTNWLSNRFLAGSWRDSDSPTTITDNTEISGSTAVFVSRASEIPATDGSVTTPFPTNYNID